MRKNYIFVGGDSDLFDSGTFESRNDQMTATIRFQNDNSLVSLTGRSPELNKRGVTWSKKTCVLKSKSRLVGSRGMMHPTVRGRCHG